MGYPYKNNEGGPEGPQAYAPAATLLVPRE